MRRVAVDLTQLRGGGEQGGAKLVALSLIAHFATLAPDVHFTLLTVDKSHAELSVLEGPNVRRLCVMREPDQRRPLTRARILIRERLARRLSTETMVRLRAAYWSLRYRPQRGVAKGNRTDLLFSPLLSTSFFDAAIPFVPVVHDLQHLYHPEFFTPEQRSLRSHQLEAVSTSADRVICISHHARQTLIQATSVRPERVTVIHLAPLQPFEIPSQADVAAALRNLQVSVDEFLLYPANFWAHKNHARLLQGFAAHLSTQPTSPLRLVCPGAPDERLPALRELADGLGIAERVCFPGYVSTACLSALLHACRALIFPSLFEGFGMPVLEAMAFGKPVLCSTASSLPEVAGDAAISFDPTDSAAIAEAIGRIDADAVLRESLVQRGHEQVRSFGTSREMAQRYLSVFDEVVAARVRAAGAAPPAEPATS